MVHIALINQRRIVRSCAVWTLALVVLLGIVGLAAPPQSLAAPKTSGTQKTERECKDDRAKCQKACDQLIDIGDTIKRCKDLCTDDYLICLPLRSGQPGGQLKGIRPSTLPDMKAPITRRGIEGEQQGKPIPGQTEEPNQAGESK
ncbi:MAG: hypothetical protein KC592_04825 [Nitrospira sp.]|nr:hypothetical protein [Nitrospira sp.]